jgi:hypothetical protein
VFLDPPYAQEAEYQGVLEALGRQAPALAIAQHDKRLVLAERYGSLTRKKVLDQGDNRLSFYRAETNREGV